MLSAKCYLSFNSNESRSARSDAENLHISAAPCEFAARGTRQVRMHSPSGEQQSLMRRRSTSRGGGLACFDLVAQFDQVGIRLIVAEIKLPNRGCFAIRLREDPRESDPSGIAGAVFDRAEK